MHGQNCRYVYVTRGNVQQNFSYVQKCTKYGSFALQHGLTETERFQEHTTELMQLEYLWYPATEFGYCLWTENSLKSILDNVSDSHMGTYKDERTVLFKTISLDGI